MTILDRTHTTHHDAPASPPIEGRSPHHRILLAAVAVVALAIGGIAGWMIRGSDDPEIVLAGDGDLTTRQEQMLDLVHDAEQAWQAGDADAVLALFTPDGTFQAFDTVYRADDGSLAAYVEAGTWTSLDVLEPMLVLDDELVAFHHYGGADYDETFTFTAVGDLLITSQVIH